MLMKGKFMTAMIQMAM